MESNSLTAERLRELLRYDPETGLFTRLAAHTTKRLGRVVKGGDNGDGYGRVTLDGSRYYLHRLAWLYMTGAWPTQEIDHCDGDKSNNRWSNLRDVPVQVNRQNRRSAERTSATQVLGVSVCARTGKFVAQITNHNRNVYLGRFKTAPEAHDAYIRAKRQMHAGCTL